MFPWCNSQLQVLQLCRNLMQRLSTLIVQCRRQICRCLTFSILPARHGYSWRFLMGMRKMRSEYLERIPWISRLVMQGCLESHWLAPSMKGWLCSPGSCLGQRLCLLLAVQWRSRQSFGKSPAQQWTLGSGLLAPSRAIISSYQCFWSVSVLPCAPICKTR